MIPQKGQYVKIVFKNATQMEGFVESWSDQQSILKSTDNNLLIIFHTSEDILAVKIVLNFIPPGELHKRLIETQQKFDDIKKSPSNDDLRIKKLADLRRELINQEKEIVKQRIHEHHISQISEPQYGIPSFTKKHRTK